MQTTPSQDTIPPGHAPSETDAYTQLIEQGYCLLPDILPDDLLTRLRIATDALLARQTPEQAAKFRAQGSMFPTTSDPLMAELWFQPDPASLPEPMQAQMAAKAQTPPADWPLEARQSVLPLLARYEGSAPPLPPVLYRPREQSNTETA